MENNKVEKKISLPARQARAKKKVKDLKGFYIHLTVYVLVNAFITVNRVIADVNGGATLGEAFFDMSVVFTWGAWGIGVAFHAAKVFSFNPFFNKEWEERQIQKFMDEDQKDAENYRSIGSDYEK